MSEKKLLLPFFLLASFLVQSQKLKKADKAIVQSLKSHVEYLASDKLEGRRAGTNGESLAADYISKQFQLAGLQPRGDAKSWLQAFDINDGKEVKSSSFFFINGAELKLNKEYFPFAYSANGSLEAMPAIALPESGMPWFADLKDWIEDNKENPHFDLSSKIQQYANDAAAKGATALLVYNSSATPDQLTFDGKDKSPLSKIPVIYLTKDAGTKYLKDPSASLETKIKVELGEKKRKGHNVIGYIDNGAVNTVIIGAHFDHLGHGEDGNSMLRNDVTQIHNGADDNASGTAALIELAKLLKPSKLKANNYLFIAFSGEELGLFGSKYFTENPTVELAKTDYMVNMDMVGRLSDSSKTLTIGGIGTSPSWGKTLSSIQNKNLVLKYDSSGTGPSDHTSFYRKNIPVLFFFTGLHGDYHRPSDDANKINYNGELMVVRYVYSVIEKNNNVNKLAFTPTRESQTTTTARFSVTLGIMPDYTFSGTGIRVDGVSENRPAQKAGIKAGDVILQLGEHPVSSMEAYMQALGKFKKGESTKVKFKRGNEALETTVQF
jgi:Zn-dependent M28 family amino/carboxypeptidase